jgi:hypothetical protein
LMASWCPTTAAPATRESPSWCWSNIKLLVC